LPQTRTQTDFIPNKGQPHPSTSSGQARVAPTQTETLKIMTNPKRPNIMKIKSPEEFTKWYWLKEELIAYCQKKGIKTTGGKFEIADRIVHFLDTGQIAKSTAKPNKKISSNFDWHKEPLGLETLITDSYKNTQNMRRFMLKHAGKKFRFSVALMEWMKSNVGKTLESAVAEYRRLESQKKDKSFKTEILPHNQYNRYLRDFFADNPDKSMADARRCWQLKRALPGHYKHKVYESSDLQLRG
jgi:Domain of unknown function (DUF6434)/SAP domain-containing new25